MRIPYEKWHHLHNSFVIVPDVLAAKISATQIATLCRWESVDGLITYTPPSPSNNESLMVNRFWNDDGSPAPYCGNGHISLATLGWERFAAKQTMFGHATIAVQPHTENLLTFDITPFDPHKTVITSFVVPPDEFPEWKSLTPVGHALTFGGPHLAFWVSESLREDIMTYRIVSKETLLRMQYYQPLFAKGVNITFAFWDEQERPTGSMTFERGCARFTYASSSSMISAITVLMRQRKLALDSWFWWQFTEDGVEVCPSPGMFRMRSRASRISQGEWATDSA